jgi:hypothetical protein
MVILFTIRKGPVQGHLPETTYIHRERSVQSIELHNFYLIQEYIYIYIYIYTKNRL